MPSLAEAGGVAYFDVGDPAEFEGRVYLRRVPLDKSGSGPDGSHYGRPKSPLWWCGYFGDGGVRQVDWLLRAPTRSAAMRRVRLRLPKASFFRGSHGEPATLPEPE